MRGKAWPSFGCGQAKIGLVFRIWWDGSGFWLSSAFWFVAIFTFGLSGCFWFGDFESAWY